MARQMQKPVKNSNGRPMGCASLIIQSVLF
jgi:hypothetical protein